MKRLRQLKAKHPGAAVVCYVNSTAEVKAESDICCTSANADRVVAQIEPDREIIFLPDQYLGAYVQEVTSRQMILWPGFCPVHLRHRLIQRIPRHCQAGTIGSKARGVPDASYVLSMRPESNGRR